MKYIFLFLLIILFANICYSSNSENYYDDNIIIQSITSMSENYNSTIFSDENIVGSSSSENYNNYLSFVVMLPVDNINPQLNILNWTYSIINDDILILTYFEIDDPNSECKFYLNNINIQNQTQMYTNINNFSILFSPETGKQEWYIICFNVDLNYNQSSIYTFDVIIKNQTITIGGSGTSNYYDGKTFFLNKQKIDYIINDGDIIEGQFTIENTGQQDLLINIITKENLLINYTFFNKNNFIIPAKSQYNITYKIYTTSLDIDKTLFLKVPLIIKSGNSNDFFDINIAVTPEKNITFIKLISKKIFIKSLEFNNKNIIISFSLIDILLILLFIISIFFIILTLKRKENKKTISG